MFLMNGIKGKMELNIKKLYKFDQLEFVITIVKILIASLFQFFQEVRKICKGMFFGVKKREKHQFGKL